MQAGVPFITGGMQVTRGLSFSVEPGASGCIGCLHQAQEEASRKAYKFVETGEGTLPGGIGSPPPGGPRYATFYVSVQSLEESLERAESLGGKTLMAPMDVMEGVRRPS